MANVAQHSDWCAAFVVTRPTGQFEGPALESGVCGHDPKRHPATTVDPATRLLPINAPGSSDPTGSFADTGNGQAVANALETASEEMSPPTCANRSRSVAWVIRPIGLRNCV